MAHGPEARPVAYTQYGAPVYQWEIDQWRRERAEQDARDARARAEEAGLKPVRIWGRLVQGMCSCGREILEGTRFCDACGRSLSYTGKTERLG